MDININEYVLVKLTPYAVEVMSENHANLFIGAKYVPPFEPPPVDAEGYSKMQLWGLMREFGGVMWVGNPNQCFEGNLIRFIGA